MPLGPALRLRFHLSTRLGQCSSCLHCVHCHQQPDKWPHRDFHCVESSRVSFWRWLFSPDQRQGCGIFCCCLFSRVVSYFSNRDYIKKKLIEIGIVYCLTIWILKNSELTQLLFQSKLFNHEWMNRFLYFEITKIYCDNRKYAVSRYDG